MTTPTLTNLPKARRVRVEISQEVIVSSTRRDSSHCMIADGIRAAVPEAKRITVDLQTVRFTVDDLRYTYLTPRSAQLALIDFDQGQLPEPFRFQLREGQVTLSRSKSPRSGRGTQAQAKQRRAAANKGRLVVNSTRGGDIEHAPTRSGGKTPPVSSFARRRAFGLRGLSR